MKQHGLFVNMGTVLLYAVFGTLFSIFSIGIGLFLLAKYGIITGISGDNPLEAMIFGALISSTDPVATLSIMGEVFHVDQRESAPLVYNLVFGESVLNDGVAIVAYRILCSLYSADSENFTLHPLTVLDAVGDFFIIAFGSIFVAFICAAVISLLFKHTGIREHYSAEVLSIYLVAAVAYSWAELMGLSGILAVFFCALFLSHYTWYNISTYAQITTKTTFKLFSHLSEIIIFQILGSSPFMIVEHFDSFVPSFIGFTILIMLVARAVQTIIFSGLANITRRQKITPKTQFFIFYAGLRGSVAFALALNTTGLIPNSDSIIACTVVIVVFTNVLMGGLTAPLLRLFDYMHEIEIMEFIPLVGGEHDISTVWRAEDERQKKSYFAQKMKNFDIRYLKPFLTVSANHKDGDLRRDKTDRGDYQKWINIM